MNDIEWLRALDGRINPRGNTTLVQKLAAEEWLRAASILHREKLIIVPHNAGMGFNFGISVFEPPLYPGLPCTPVLHVGGDHLGMRFAEAWAMLSPFSHNEPNRALLALYGADEAIVKFGGLVTLRERDYYAY